jgi:hypothetical protein
VTLKTPSNINKSNCIKCESWELQTAFHSWQGIQNEFKPVIPHLRNSVQDQQQMTALSEKKAAT